MRFLFCLLVIVPLACSDSVASTSTSSSSSSSVASSAGSTSSTSSSTSAASSSNASSSGASSSTSSSSTSGGGAGGAGGSSGAGAGGACVTPVTFTQVLAAPLQSCGGEPLCHKLASGGLHMDPNDPLTTYQNLMKPAMVPNAGLRVKPGDPAASFLYRKLVNDLKPTEGGPMPSNTLPNTPWTELPPDQIELVRCWIQEGALNN